MTKQAVQKMDEVLKKIQEICDRCVKGNDPRGYFAAMYLEVTNRIRDRIAADTPVFPDLLASVDAGFAERYLSSLENEDSGSQTFPLWDQVFAYNRLRWPCIVQHLMASCIVHIGFDLGLAVSQIVRRDDMDEFRTDFESLNKIMCDTFLDINNDIKQISFLYKVATIPFNFVINKFVDYTIVAERDNAWNFALALQNAKTEVERRALIRHRWDECNTIFEEFSRPAPIIGLPLKGFSWLLKETEAGSVSDQLQIFLNSSAKLKVGKSIAFDPSKGPTLTDRKAMPKKKIAILGGGIASMSTAFHLTEDLETREQLDITIYQLGWRLGGKGATGRNENYGMRIEEHGLHMWFGFYDNAFQMMRRAFMELQRPESYPVRDFDTAFEAIDNYTFAQKFNNESHLWHIYWPPNDRTPGDFEPLGLGDALVSVVNFIKELFTGNFDFSERSTPFKKSYSEGPVGLGETFVDWLEASFEGSDRNFNPSVETSQNICTALEFGRDALKILLGDSVNTDINSYRIWIMADISVAIVCGILKERLFEVGFATINNYDWQDWVKKQGVSQITFDSCLVQVGYDSSFAFYQGKFNMEAGVMLDGALKMFFGYKGSIVYRFHAGTGESIVEPLHECLKKRGVKFEFFSKVTEIHANENSEIDFVSMEQQATPIGEYDPFVQVKNMRCWPDHPKYELLKEGKALKEGQYNLESHWCDWKSPRSYQLKKGVDFDEVVCGISIQALHHLTPSLSQKDARWATMLDKVKTTRTQAFQLWMAPTLQECGWKGDNAILSCNGEPLDSYADLSCVLPFEDWKGAQEPGSVGYFCGAMIDGDDVIPPPSDTSYPKKEMAKVEAMALDYVNTKLEPSWPNTFSNGKFKWELLVGPKASVKGADRFQSQFWKANIDPSERYVLSVVDSTRFRLRSAESGFSNLFLSGDWTLNGSVDAGCMEAAVLSGKQAALGIVEKRGLKNTGVKSELSKVSPGGTNSPNQQESNVISRAS